MTADVAVAFRPHLDLAARLDAIVTELSARGVPLTPLNVLARATDLGAHDAEAAALAELLEQRQREGT